MIDAHGVADLTECYYAFFAERPLENYFEAILDLIFEANPGSIPGGVIFWAGDLGG